MSDEKEREKPEEFVAPAPRKRDRERTVTSEVPKIPLEVYCKVRGFSNSLQARLVTAIGTGDRTLDEWDQAYEEEMKRVTN